MHLTWLGHSCFKIEKEGYTVIVDPYKDDSVPGLRKIRETADLVFCSHEHGDHCGRECVKIREGGKNPFQITEIPTYHDDSEGSQRGKNIIRIFDDGEARIAHFGDLGCLLTPEQEELLGGLDLVLIPVGGFYTIDGETAAEIVKRIKPKKVIPMHYRDSKRGYGYEVIGPVQPFTKAFPDVVVMGGSEADTEKDYGGSVLILEPKNV